MWTVVLLSGVILHAEPAVEVQPLSGKPVSGVLSALTAEKIALQTAQGPVTLEIGKIVGLTVKQPEAGGRGRAAVWLELVDGSAPAGTQLTVKEGRARLTLADGATLDVPVRDVRWVRFGPQTEATARQWSRILEKERKADLLVVKKGDSLDENQGVLRSVAEDTVQFELDGELLPVKRERVYGLVYHQASGRELPRTLCTIREAAGPAWAAQSLAANRGQLEWTTPTGLKLARPLAALSRIDFSHGKIVYLSDLKPESAEWVPYFAMAGGSAARAGLFAPRQDRSLASGPLAVEGMQYPRGLALHSRTTLVYRLPESFRRFSAVAGIDDRVRPRGQVLLVIRGDERVLWNSPVAGTDPAKTIDVDVSGVRRLTILVDFGDDLAVADHLDLCEARLIK